MKPHRHYKKAPIIEALIDLRVEFSSDVTLSTLRKVQSDTESDYPLSEEITLAQTEFQVGSSVTAIASQSTVGYRFYSSDRKQILQARLDGFSFSQLEPYHTWNSLQNEAKRLWKIYADATQVSAIQRVAVRYINRLDLPFDSSGLLDFKEYLRTVPEVSPDLFQGLKDYVMQLQIPQEDLEAVLNLTEAMLPSTDNHTISVLLDIDLFSFVKLPAASSSTVWEILEKFRTRKNEVFEACITDKTRELFN